MEWYIPDADNVAPDYQAPAAATPHLQSIRYPEMPSNNSGFGEKTLELRFEDRPDWKADQEVVLRFERDGHAAANQNYNTLDNVVAGNPNWYVYWQQVAEGFGFGPQTDMVYMGPDPDKLGTYSFQAVPDGQDWRWDEEILIYEKNRDGSGNDTGIVTLVKTIAHENGHRQSKQLPNAYGGWGPNLQYDDAKGALGTGDLWWALGTVSRRTLCSVFEGTWGRAICGVPPPPRHRRSSI